MLVRAIETRGGVVLGSGFAHRATHAWGAGRFRWELSAAVKRLPSVARTVGGTR